MSDYDERRKETADAMLALVALEPVTNAVLVQTVGPERKIVISIMLKDEAERANMEKLARIVEQLIIHPSQPFVHPAFPYENPRTPIDVCGSCGFAPTIIDEPDMMAIRCQRANCKANPSAVVTLRAIYGESARADVVDAWNHRQAELRAENHPRTPAETEAMLNHMADVHLTPTAEKK